MSREILVSSGEASGDRMAALVLQALGTRVQGHGMGGPASAAAGLVELVPRDFHGVMGIARVARHAPSILSAYRTLLAWADDARPGAALLVGFTDFHQHLGRALRRRGVPVLWCAAPQVWAWRPSRLDTLHTCADRLAVVLPFEERLWRQAGHAAGYVGHPALDSCRWNDSPTRRLAVLCGSREQEVRATSAALIDAARLWVRSRPSWSADVLVAASLSEQATSHLGLMARDAGLSIVRCSALQGAAAALADYDVALCASGTASLEAALSATPPVVAYRTHALLRLAAWALLQTPDIALPNVVLGRRAFPEIVQDRLDSRELLEALEAVVAHRSRCIDACARLNERMRVDDGRTFGDRVAQMLDGLMR